MLSFLVSAMEGPLLSSQQIAFIFPVGLVIVFVLVFTFGFKSSVEPPSFKYISSATEDRKNVKKKKVKDKKPQSNGHATVVIDVVDNKKAEPTKTKQANKVETPKQKKHVDAEKVQEKKPEVLKSPSKKEKKASKKNVDIEKPVDFDEGEWEVAPSRKDKKSKKKDEIDLLAILPDKKKKSGTKRDDKVTVFDPAPMEILKLEDILPKPKEVEEVQPAPIAVEPVVDDQAGKKKKKKAAKVSASEEEVVAAAQAPAPAPAAAAAPVAQPAPVAAEPANESHMAFNELEDAWKEAPQKKSKKKVRKD